MNKLIISIVIISLLTGCGGGGGSAPDTTPSPTPAPSPTPTVTLSKISFSETKENMRAGNNLSARTVTATYSAESKRK